MNMKKPVVLVVLDGWGYRVDPKNNAIAAAPKPNFDKLWHDYPHATLAASGAAVGLPDGQMGNSEVGHTTIGAGKIIESDLVRLDKAAADGALARNPAVQQLFATVKEKNSTLHFLGLIGPGGVHAHSRHLSALLRAAHENGITKVVIHAFLDGRDTPPQSAADYLAALEQELKTLGLGRIATISGRYYAMDRDHNWDRLDLALAAMFDNRGEQAPAGSQPSEYLRELYRRTNQFDELLKPTVFPDQAGQFSPISQHDGIFFFNFRPDRARMLTEKLVAKKQEFNLTIATMTNYGPVCQDCLVAFPPIMITTTLAQEISQAGLTQAHIAETEKFAHATYFLNGGKTEPFRQERDILLDSRKDVATHDLAPEMRAAAITDKAVAEIRAGTDFIFINYANADMVGHTAKVEAIETAIETVDQELGKLQQALEQVGGLMLITADHGNAEVNMDEHGTPHTAHTANPVPVILTDHEVKLRVDGGLSDVAPTILELLGLTPPEAMTGKSLVSKQ